ncbi:MAG: HAD-IIIC family phosphatase [Candidatus Acidiferrales bacterium]
MVAHSMKLGSMSAAVLLRKRKSLLRESHSAPNLTQVRVAILGGSTTNEIADFIELLLLEKGIEPVFYQSGFNRYFEESVLDPSPLIEFNPDIAYIHTSQANIQAFPPLDATESQLQGCVQSELQRFAAIWQSLTNNTHCTVIQNNFEPPAARILGNLDGVVPGGQTRMVNCLNSEFAREANSNSRLIINDINAIAASLGLIHFHDARRWFSYKLITSPEGSLEIAKSVTAIISALYGRSRKCLVLDLDNTLWGGSIGDEGADKIRIGKETPEAEAYTAFQEYCLRLRERGVLLAVCSKNSEETAKEGFAHPDSLLKLSDFSCFKANWNPKHENIAAIAKELNIGLESMVFVDDSAAERELVSAQLPMVAVPDVGSDITNFIAILDGARYFEPAALTNEDLSRGKQYEANSQRALQQSQFASYEDYLDSLEMSAEIGAFRPMYLERIAQLTNKTNQFNLTTRRYTPAEIETIAADPGYLTLYGKLSDKFGDNGLISVIIGRQELRTVHLDLWLMSCRVVKRDMEFAMLDALVAACHERGVLEILGYYLPSQRNSMVSDLYAKLGFNRVAQEEDGRSVWKLELNGQYVPRNKHIRELVHG